ncbi:diguanylate cyclase domain-containing protein [Rhodoferax sp. BLA1]|uniref:diguanylate cyclase domain-containing protein n=1 Tax=Rhodoferax sp. BLA1 TaxID=2576062 RepID=UPI0015D1A501|nr:diguanylate cyclase [Rhodoferax sp. BLA1]
MRHFLHHLLLGSLRRQLVSGTVLCVALTLSALVWDLTRRQQEALLAVQPSQTAALADAALQAHLAQLTRDGVIYVLLGTVLAAFFSVAASGLLARRRAATTGLVPVVEPAVQHAEENSEAFKSLILDSVAAGVAVIDHHGSILAVNEQWRRFAPDHRPASDQAGPHTTIGANYLQACGVTYTSDNPTLGQVREGVEAVLAGRSTHFCLDYPTDSPDQQRWFCMVVRPLHLHTHGGAVITCTDISATKLTERREQFRGHILELMTGDARLPDVLRAMVLGVEQLHPAMLCSIVLLDIQGRHLECSIAPSLPDFYNQALVGLVIGVGQGSCGTAAATGQRVIVEDIATHPYWANYKALALQAGLRACWSQPVRSSSGRVLGTFAIYHRQVNSPAPHDIALIEQSAHLVSIALDQKATQDALRASEDMFRTLFETLPTGVLYQNLDGVITSANPAAQRLLGLTLDQLQGTTCTDPRWRAIHEDGSDFPGEQHPISRALRTGQPVRNVIMGIAVPERDYVWLLVSAMPLFKDGKLAQAYVVFEDVTDRHEMEQQVRHMAFYDALTQLPNRRLLTDRLAQAITASRRSGCYGAMMYIDLDNFKPINDRHGHELGDMLLSELARRLKACVREVDTVARIGGDEFVVMLTDLAVDAGASTAQAQVVAGKILTSLAEPYVLIFCDTGDQTCDVGHRCTASIGVTLFSHRDTSQAQILHRADVAMYQAKGEGRNRVRFFEAP